MDFRVLVHYRLPICPCQICVGNAVKTPIIGTVFSTRITNSQSPLVADDALNCSEMHLPVYQSMQLIFSTRINVYHCVATQFRIVLHCCLVIHYRKDKRRLKGFNSI